MRPHFFRFIFLLVVLFGDLLTQAQSNLQSSASTAPIQDNSFLIEEAYNQEDGVIQHISTFERLTNSRDWVYTQTDEWPVRTYKHQVSVTLAATHAGSFAGSGAGWGDMAFNYRYQLVGSGETRVAVAPRLSALLPTGDHKFGRGSGGVGWQTNLPLSIQHSAHWVTHWNAGATWIPHALDQQRESATTTAVNLGQSIVWLARPRLNFLLETLWTSSEQVVGPRKAERSQDLYVSPGVRWAYNLSRGLQIVPGVAAPIGIGPCAGEKGVIFYLSFEHPFGLAHSQAR
jgi:Putative MetA-pathway of phenol degradation